MAATPMTTPDSLFFEHAGLDHGNAKTITAKALSGMDDGELYLEYTQSESLAFDDGRLKSASFNTAQGFGLRAVKGETSAYAHASELSEAALKRAAATVRAANYGQEA